MNRLRIFIALITLSMMAAYAEAAYNTVENVTLTDEVGYSTVTILFSGHAREYKIDPDLSSMVIRVYIPKTGISAELYTEDLTGKRIKNIRVDMESGGEAMAEIFIRDIKTSIYHSLSADGKSLTLRLKSRKKLMVVDTDKKAAKIRNKRQEREKELIKEMEDINKFAGRDLYLEAMKAFQKVEFEVAEE